MQNRWKQRWPPWESVSKRHHPRALPIDSLDLHTIPSGRGSKSEVLLLRNRREAVFHHTLTAQGLTSQFMNARTSTEGKGTETGSADRVDVPTGTSAMRGFDPNGGIGEASGDTTRCPV